MACVVEGGHDGGEIIAVDALRGPAEGFHLRHQRLEGHHAVARAVGLLVVDIDDGDQVVELVVGGAHQRLPHGALVELAVGEQGVDEGGRGLALQAQRVAHGDGQALAERAAAHLHARRVAAHARHRQAAVVAAVGFEFALGNDAGLDQRRIQRDGVVAVGQQEAVTALPGGVLGLEGHRVEVGHRQHVGDVQGLRAVALALHLAHLQGEAAHAVGALGQRRHVHDLLSMAAGGKPFCAAMKSASIGT